MNIRHLATKSFDSGMEIRKSIIYNGVPLCIQFIGSKENSDNSERDEVTLEFNKSYPDVINIDQNLTNAKNTLEESFMGDIILDKSKEVMPLSRLYDFSVSGGSTLSDALPIGTSFDDIVESDSCRELMQDIAVSMFNNVNSHTGKHDLSRNAFYTHLVPLVTLTGVITPQTEDGNTYFNPDGTVSVAEFLDGLNAIKFGCNSNRRRKKTLDRISDENDYFNEGYQDCVRGISSPFFNLYTRKELTQPITRLELAYITVICWNQFLEKYNSVFGGNFYLGINFDWENPADYLSSYDDGFDYKVSKCVVDKEYDVISLNIKDYMHNKSMTEYKESIKKGESAIPLPMFMSMVEIGVLDLFYYEDGRLDPMKEVSRGELCYFLSMLAKLFPTKYLD